MNSPARHHYIPRMLLKRFVNSQNRLFAYNKSDQSSNIIEATPENLFVKKNFYNFVKEDGEVISDLEEAFSEIESKADPIIDTIVSDTRCNRPLSIPDRDREVLVFFFYLQQKRTPDFVSQSVRHIDYDQYFRNLIEEFKRDVRPLNRSEKQLVADPDFQKRIQRNSIVQSIARLNPRILNRLNEMTLFAAKPQGDRKSFVIGGNPFVRFGLPESSHLDHPDTKILLPIASDVSLVASSEEISGPPALLPDGQVRLINMKILKQSRMIAGRSRQLITSLSNPR
ncbi:MAG: DUF4238 domain-containing protein [Pseudomonadota bacterium]